MKLMTVLRIVFLYLLAVLVATLLGSLVQTQFNLAALQAMDVPVDLATRMQTSLQDLLSFTPIFVIMVAATLLLALPLAEALGRIFKPWRWLLYFLAGAGSPSSRDGSKPTSRSPAVFTPRSMPSRPS